MGRYDPARHCRRSIRLRSHDYRQPGAYFVTVCIQNRECLLGDVLGTTVRLSRFGLVVENGLRDLSGAVVEAIAMQPPYEVMSSVIMPNHIHFILEIRSIPSSQWRQKRLTLGQIIRNFKYETTKQINLLRDTPGIKVWQRNYYEHIIRNEASRQKLENYIQDNPRRWSIDQLHPQNPSKW